MTSNVAASVDQGAAPASERGLFGPKFVTPLYMGAALNPINSSVISTALVAVAVALHVSVGSTAVLISSLYLTSAIAQPAAGRLAEEFGPRRVFLAGILLVFAAGIIGALGHDLLTLVAARVLIGAGTSAGYPSAMLLIRRRALAAGLSGPPGGVLGGLAIAGAATVAVGPAIGGLLVGGLGWRTAFWINVPIATAAFVMAWAWVPRDADRVRSGSLREFASRIDLPGMLGFGVALTALVVLLSSLPNPDWTALAVLVVTAAALVAWELRAAQPFLDVRLLASHLALTRTYLRNGLTLLGTYVILYGLTEWLEASRGLSAYQAGLVLIPMGLLSAAGARIISRRPRVRTPLIASAVLLLVGATAALFLTSQAPLVAVIAVTAVFGLTSGASTVANQTVLYQEAPPESVGTASGLLRTFGYIGSIASAAITGTAFRTHVDDAGLHHISWALVGIAALVLVMTLFDPHLARADRADRDEPSRIPAIRNNEKDQNMDTTVPTIEPARTALLLMDFQPAVLAAVPDGDGVLSRAQAALSWARSHSVQVAYVRVALTEEDFAAVPSRNKTFGPVAENRLLADDTPETTLHESFDILEQDITVRKNRISAFASTTDLRGILRDRGIDTLVLAGLSTGGVVLTTLRQAADDDYRLYVLKDATGDPDPEVHRVLSEKVFPHQAHVVNTDDLWELSMAA